jgi:hypothetical protein
MLSKSLLFIKSLDRFQKILIVLLGLAFALLLGYPLLQHQNQKSLDSKAIDSNSLIIFYHPQCSHCSDAISFLSKQNITPLVEKVDVTKVYGQHLLNEVVRSYNLKLSELGVPLFVYNNRWRFGFDKEETTGPKLLNWINESSISNTNTKEDNKDIVNIPLIGEINIKETSLPLLTIILGMADGFNPCAMWVLVYLLSIVAGVKDKKKIWWLISTFVLASGILYFLFMTAWLSTFLLIGYTRPLTLLIALSAIGFGINHLYELIINRGKVTCDVGDIESKKQTMGKIRKVVNSPIGYASILGMLGLAFAVNAIEFVCSAALPAIYTHTLSLMQLSTVSYYLYILLYVIFFMIDDLIIFALAAFAIQKVVDSRYAAYSRLVGGVLLISLGVWMILKG